MQGSVGQGEGWALYPKCTGDIGFKQGEGKI